LFFNLFNVYLTYSEVITKVCFIYLFILNHSKVYKTNTNIGGVVLPFSSAVGTRWHGSRQKSFFFVP